MTQQPAKLLSAQNDPLKNVEYTIVVPIFDKEQAEWTVQVALDLARPQQGRVILVGMVLVPEGESLSTGAVRAQASRATLETLREQFKTEPLYIKPRIRVVHKPWQALARVIDKEQANLVVVPWRRGGTRPFFALEIDDLLGRFNCDVAVVSGDAPPQLDRILMPIRGSRESPLTLQAALAMAEALNVSIAMLYALEDDPSASSQKIYHELARMNQHNPWIEQELRVKGDVFSAILQEVRLGDLVIMGATETPPSQQKQAIGPLAHRLRRTGVEPLVIVKTYRPPPLTRLAAWSQARPLPATTTSVVVDKWFAENTFHSLEFEDLERLVALKEEQGLTISLGLPALNEEETVGRIIRVMQNRLMREFPLLDEIVLIDSDSTDETVEIARDLGIPVYQHHQILPEQGAFRGKGEALWKSLHVLKGDLIAWIDTDIVNIHPRFVYGILGPLLRHDTIQYVKGFYRRPLRVGDTLQAGGGGRVTELVARPLINLFYPELSGIVQPLSGEYAGRRPALERMSFYVGYGVETGLLLSLVETYGISGIAQVDLQERVHHNQSLSALSRMAFAIIQVFVDHLESRQKVELLHEINRTMKIIRSEHDSFYLEERAISDQRRPPIITIPEYRARHGITAWPEDEAKSSETSEPEVVA
jgi:glucosyl-3-phosphoglycerate synthase